MAYLHSYHQGKRGEELALKFLENQGYVCITKNFRIPGGEIDLIMQKNGILIFVEVKARSNLKFGDPEEAFHYFKKAKILTTIHHYLSFKNVHMVWRLDLITLYWKGKNTYIKHFKDILQND